MTVHRTLYLDHAATTPVDPAVAEAMLRCLGADGAFANASSSHAPGRAAAHVVEGAMRAVAARIGAQAEDIVFTSGATEANNLAIKGLLAAAPAARRHVVTTRIEHKSVLDTAAAVAAAGASVSYVGCGADGIVSPEEIAAAMRPETALVSVMRVNNETGMIQPTVEIAEICRARGVPLHVDAAQAVGKIAVDVQLEGYALCSLTAHKIGGPKGIGALWIRPDVAIVPLVHGGEQQRGLRPGTVPTHQIAGMGKAFELADPAVEGVRLAALRARLWQALEPIAGACVNGALERGAPHILNVAFPGVDGESLRFALRDIAVSAGSACMSDDPEASYVLSAMGLTDAAATSSIRFSVGRTTTSEDIDAAGARVRQEVVRLRELADGAPAWSATRCLGV